MFLFAKLVQRDRSRLILPREVDWLDRDFDPDRSQCAVSVNALIWIRSGSNQFESPVSLY